MCQKSQFSLNFTNFFLVSFQSPVPENDEYSPEGELLKSASQNPILAENTVFETTVRGMISHIDESANKFLRVLGKMNTYNFSGFVTEKIPCMLLRNEK